MPVIEKGTLQNTKYKTAPKIQNVNATPSFTEEDFTKYKIQNCTQDTKKEKSKLYKIQNTKPHPRYKM